MVTGCSLRSVLGVVAHILPRFDPEVSDLVGAGADGDDDQDFFWNGRGPRSPARASTTAELAISTSHWYDNV